MKLSCVRQTHLLLQVSVWTLTARVLEFDAVVTVRVRPVSVCGVRPTYNIQQHTVPSYIQYVNVTSIVFFSGMKKADENHTAWFVSGGMDDWWTQGWLLGLCCLITIADRTTSRDNTSVTWSMRPPIYQYPICKRRPSNWLLNLGVILTANWKMYTLLRNLTFIIVNKQNVTVDFCPNIRQSEQLIIRIETSLSPYCVETILNPRLQHLRP